jgi:heme/copper-type cytochrome/quinol oxidase subunit 4
MQTTVVTIGRLGFWCGIIAAASAIAFDIAQIAQIAGALRFPLDEILIYGTSLCIVIPLLLQMLAFHHLTQPDRQIWSHAALLLTVLYAVFVVANYVVQLATVIPAKLRGTVAEIAILEQTPHSLFWNFDAIGYIAMGLATLVAIPAFGSSHIDRLAKFTFGAHALVTPLIAVVYFFPDFSERLLLLGLPWAVTAPLFMIVLAVKLQPSATDREENKLTGESQTAD